MFNWLRLARMFRSKRESGHFVVDVQELSRQNSLTELILNDPVKLEFILESAVAAHLNDRCSPSALTYYKKICNESLSGVQLVSFFNSLHDVKEFIVKLTAKAARKGVNDNDLLEVYSSVCSLPSLMFMRLLYFTIFTCDINFKESTLKKHRQCSIFEVTQSREKEDHFAALPGTNSYLFFATGEENLYIICRKGITHIDSNLIEKNSIGLAETINTAIDFATAIQRGIGVLCYEVKNFVERDTLKSNGHYSTHMYMMPEADICLRTILWFRGEDLSQAPTIANEVVRSLNSQKGASSQVQSVKAPASAVAPSAAPASAIPAAPPAPPKPKFTAPPNSPRLTVQYPTYEPHGYPAVASKSRVIKEIQELMNNPPEGAIHRINHLHDGKLESPLLVEMNIPAGCKLHKQGKSLGISTVVFACYLPQDYPFTAVQIRVVRPRIRRHTGHVTFGGSVCADMLYANGWSPNNTIAGSLLSCMYLICDDTIQAYGQIEPSTVGNEYTYQEFVESYSFTGNTHRWKM